MSNFKKVPVSGGASRRDVLASLKMASMEILVPVLPAGMRLSVFCDCLYPGPKLTERRVDVPGSELCWSNRPHPGRSDVQTHAGDGIRGREMGTTLETHGLLE